jgi:hypothetical protein
MVLIGSKAIKHHFADFPREPKDMDFIVKQHQTQNEPGVEYLLNPILENYPENVLGINELYTLKCSHLFWDINWSKHMFDCVWLRNKGARLDRTLFYKLYEYFNTVHIKNKRSDLKMSSEDFFNNAIICDYSHDDLHTIINPVPTYTKILADGAQVEVDEEKFKSLTHEEKCDLVREEIFVMAFERYKAARSYLHAYSKMLKKFIVSHAPLWEAIFIIENYVELHKPKINFIKQIEDGLKTIKPITERPKSVNRRSAFA